MENVTSSTVASSQVAVNFVDSKSVRENVKKGGKIRKIPGKNGTNGVFWPSANLNIGLGGAIKWPFFECFVKT